MLHIPSFFVPLQRFSRALARNCLMILQEEKKAEPTQSIDYYAVTK